ncbi:MAG: hypothetical protein EOS65_04160 [Mesorhizobium sp.]|uniref:hypothetical protein n=1 Tax=Mesorhizobium sp. TaxID=1871066 RepID=UPI000FD4BC1E|nr:hypothetical protein [Mesorhizobium sp.]RVC62461.1 hypothetical protein EN779_07725 [Mesorhizobium sp. M4B.F.Ca.ET.088.02.2.1]RWF33509.1 MAG: hypothetical protein EOS45_03220 [Mesorhizobium sp.]RWF43832.1 MAG: hypothetical protein EOS65_04160 [Mesorhizobium sp.]TIX10490.1 MAG: hypothetical protein E5V41_29045 [Mesorhizobium sp.]TIX37611.1 MAG: hypothetical protein E5V40_21780 [Mesorhizobium sp.]
MKLEAGMVIAQGQFLACPAFEERDGDLASKSHISSSVAGTIGEDACVAQSDYLNALLAFLV